MKARLIIQQYREVKPLSEIRTRRLALIQYMTNVLTKRQIPTRSLRPSRQDRNLR